MIDGFRTELEAVRAEAMGSPPLPSAVVAGGGGAGIVAGGVVALTGGETVVAGAAVLGLVLVGAAVLIAR